MVFNLINFCHVLQQIHPSINYKCNRLKKKFTRVNSLCYLFFLFISYLSPLFFFVIIICHHLIWTFKLLFNSTQKRGKIFNDSYLVTYLPHHPSLIYSRVLDEHNYLYTYIHSELISRYRLIYIKLSTRLSSFPAVSSSIKDGMIRKTHGGIFSMFYYQIEERSFLLLRI